MPKVSIVVPVYNVEQYLRPCVESVLSQTMSDWELLLVDDGSSDASGAIIEEYAALDGRIRGIHQENAGAGAARNRGLEQAGGEFPFDDKASPEQIREKFGISKAAFKRAVGHLLKEGKIVLLDGCIRKADGD